MIVAVLDGAGSLLRDNVPEAVFPWWSFTKPAIAALVLQAAENGLISLDAPLPGRVWVETGYGLGIMNGTAEGAGRLIGHTGCGPFCANLVAQFPNLPGRPIAASFVEGGSETPAEFAAVRAALEAAGPPP